MTNRATWLISLCLLLIFVWTFFFIPWGGSDIEILVQHKKGPNNTSQIFFGFNKAYDTTMIEVHRLEQNEQGEWVRPLYGLEADPVWRVIPRGADVESRTVQALIYGERPRGMRNDVRPKDIDPQGHYMLTIETLEGTGTTLFFGSPQQEPAAPAQEG